MLTFTGSSSIMSSRLSTAKYKADTLVEYMVPTVGIAKKSNHIYDCHHANDAVVVTIINFIGVS